MSKSKSHWVSEWVSQWQGHLLSCSGQLKMSQYMFGWKMSQNSRVKVRSKIYLGENMSQYILVKICHNFWVSMHFLYTVIPIKAKYFRNYWLSVPLSIIKRWGRKDKNIEKRSLHLNLKLWNWLPLRFWRNLDLIVDLTQFCKHFWPERRDICKIWNSPKPAQGAEKMIR